MKLVLKAQPGRKPSFTNHSNRIVTQNYPPPQNCLKDHISGTVSQPWEFHCFAMGMHTLNRKSQDVPLPLPQRASLCLVSYQFLLGFFIFVRVGVRDLTFTCITISSNSRRSHPGRAWRRGCTLGSLWLLTRLNYKWEWIGNFFKLLSVAYLSWSFSSFQCLLFIFTKMWTHFSISTKLGFDSFVLMCCSSWWPVWGNLRIISGCVLFIFLLCES